MANDPHEEDDDEPRHYKAKRREKATFRPDNSEAFVRLVDDITKAGGAIRFGRSRDGGILAIGIYGIGSNPYTVYLKDAESVVAHMKTVLDRLTFPQEEDEHAQ
jgi:hypothetical protein